MSQKQKQKPKLKGKPGNGGPVSRGAPLTGTVLSQLSADSANIEGMAEYRRKDESQIILPEANITTELTADSAINTRRCYFISWLVPDPANDRGALLSVEKFVVHIVNEGIFDVNLVLQQPHGHETCPSSLAAWVLLGNMTLKSGGTVRETIRPVDNNFVVPYRVDVAGADTIAFLAFSAARQGMSAGGGVAEKTEVGLRIVVEAHYKASGNALQSGKFFTMRALSDDAIMTQVDSKPPVPISVRDVAPGCTKLSWSAGLIEPVFWRGTNVITGDQLPGLDTKHIYRLPYPVIGDKAVGLYMRYISTTLTGKWQVVSKPDGSTGIKIGQVSNDNLGDISGDALLVPLSKYNFLNRVPVQRSATINVAAVVRTRGGGGVEALLSKTTWRDDFMSSISFIVSVIKVAAAVAGAVGLLNVVGDVEPGYVSC